MTEDYKERIIKWLTGNYEIEQSSTNPLFEEMEQTTTTINSYFDEILGYIQGIDGKGNDLDIGFIYGNKNNKGIVVIVDSEFNIIQTIDEYDSGTDFSEFVCLNIDKTNGNIYGIDYSSSKYRFILLNNFMVKTPIEEYYTVKLRNSYFLEFTNNTFIPKFVEKRPSDSFYVIVGSYIDSGSLNDLSQPAIATYKIEVGATNEFNDYYYTDSYAYREFYLKAYNIIWSGEEYSIRLSGFTWFQLDPRFSAEIYYQEFSFENETFTLDKDIELTFSKSNLLEFEETSDFILDNTNSYVLVFSTDLGYSETVLYKILTTTYEEYQKINQTTAIDTLIGGGKLFKKKNQVFYFMYLNTSESQDTSNIEFTIQFGAIASSYGSMYILCKTYENMKLYDLLNNSSSRTFTVSNIYNLYSYNLIGTGSNKMLSIREIFNELNYNYDDYEDLNSLVPHSAWLYDENDKLIFARNLYNKVVNGNITSATLEVPNLLLNDINIDTQNLLGGTNGILVNNNETITKNVYEDLFINFYNTLTIENRNTAIFIPNLVGASRLNSSISNVIDYSNAKIGKIRINYSDNTTFVKTINPATKISKFVYQYTFNVYVPGTKDITSIDLISQDEGTTYQTIAGTSLLRNKSYKITQNVEIGE